MRRRIGRARDGRRQAFTFTDLVVCLIMAALILAMGVNAVHKARDGGPRTQCASVLRQIGTAMVLYANANNGAFPRTRYAPGPTVAFAQYTGASAADPFAPDGPQPNDVTASPYLLLRTQGLPAYAFMCPSTTTIEPAPEPLLAASNFAGGRYLAYGFAVMYPDAAAVRSGYKWDSTLNADFAIGGDMNSGDPALSTLTPTSPRDQIERANSRNHGGQGQNVLFGDGHVEWADTPFVGVNKDNIYTTVLPPTGNHFPPQTSATIVGPPGWRGDTVLLPIATVDPGSTHRPEKSSWTSPIVIGASVVLVVATSVITYVARRRKAAVRD
ncbi:MAG TPA: hypothetical protein VEA69_17380 [Tepidisphaeraceae bacterium]|nr:hypothetical protein [Tepidisphaeraceae bacterium]